MGSAPGPDIAMWTHGVFRRNRQFGSPARGAALMVRIKDLALMACLMITVSVTTADVELGQFAQVQKSYLGA
jgi:hypothetical protein